MEANEYRKRGKEMVDYIADYLENIRDRRVFPDVKPGYMREMLPENPPNDGEAWERIFKDVEGVIMPGVTHWQSPYMHAYFPALNSYPSLLGDMLADGINCLGFTWASSPACTELETIVMDWLGMMIGLPDGFLHRNLSTPGGGVIQTTASEATFVCLLAGRTEAIKRYQKLFPEIEDADINSRLVAYCSDQAHSSVEKAGLIGLVKIRYIESDEKLSLRGDKLKEAIAFDKENGYIPFFLCATLGTTGACAFDNLVELGPICQAEEMWLHVDAAYAGSAFVCPEFRTWMTGIEYADSLAFNPSKWLLVHFDCTAMWVKNSKSLHKTFNVEPLYLQHENTGLAIDYMHWQVPLSKRFRALKLWFVIRSYGVTGLQAHIRKGVALAQKFEQMVISDERFEVPIKCHLGMVVFRMKGENDMTENLLKKLNGTGQMHCVPASLKGKYVIRFTVTSAKTTIQDLVRDWKIIQNTATVLLGGEVNPVQGKTRVPLKEIREKNPHFGTSLLLANIGPNSTMSPKIINGSFAALFDNNEVFQDFSKRIQDIGVEAKDSATKNHRVRGMLLKSGKQFSLDSHIDFENTVGPHNNDHENSLAQQEYDQERVAQLSRILAHMTPRSRSHSVNDKSVGGVCGIFSRKSQQPLIEQEEDDCVHIVIKRESLAELQQLLNDDGENHNPTSLALVREILVTNGILL